MFIKFTHGVKFIKTDTAYRAVCTPNGAPLYFFSAMAIYAGNLS